MTLLYKRGEIRSVFVQTLFRGWYKAILVEADSYLLELLRYAHRNPLEAGLVKVLDKYPRVSHQGYYK